MSEKVSNGKGFAVFSMLLGILSCFYTFTYIFYAVSFASGALLDSILGLAESTNSYDIGFWIMEIGCFVFIIITAFLSIIFSVIASKKGNKSKMKNAGIVLSGIALGVSIVIFFSTVIFLLLNL